MLSAENEDISLDIEAVFLSNSVEVLFEHLKAHLFSEERLSSDSVFSERILITPSGGMEQWIQTHLATSLGVASGITATFLDKGAAKIREAIYEPHQGNPLSSKLELFLQIEASITEALSQDTELWKPLVNYVQGKEIRKTALALYLAQLFERYGVSAAKAAFSWEKNPSNWQEALWGKVFSRWDYPQRAFHDLKPKTQIPTHLSVHLFGFSHISPLYFHFFRLAARYIPVYFYQLSPCQEFWSDLPGDHPSLLGPLGKVGREMARLIEESDLSIDESYLIFGGETQLKRIQREILTLQKEPSISDDPSIQVHAVSTLHQEVSNLHQLLTKLTSEGKTEPKDILVMAPNITDYAPYIQAIFGKTLDYQIADMPLQKGLPAVEALFLMLDLEKKRWSAPAVLELFDHPLFRQKMGFSEEDLGHIRTWVGQTGIRWAMNGAHRSQLLREDREADEGATWMEGLGHLIEELAVPHHPPRIDFVRAETLGKTVEVLASLYQETRAWNHEKTLADWVAVLKKLVNTYLLCDESCEPLLELFQRIEKGGKHFSDSLYSFHFFYTLLQENDRNDSVTINRNQLQAVRFCSMLPMRAIPAKIICLLGMNHDAFPRKEQLQALDLLGQHPLCGYSPSRIDFDRSLFLEAMLSAREKLVISYLGQDSLDLSPLPPSSVVSHLLPFISKNQIFIHPAHTLDKVHIASATPLQHPQHPFQIPQGDHEISTVDMARFSRSFLGHYLNGQGLRVGEEKLIQEEETFLLSHPHKALLRKEALHVPLESVLEKVKKEGDFPIGAFGTLARLQLEEEIQALPSVTLQQIVLEPFTVAIQPSLTITFTGVIDGVYNDGLCVQGKKDFRTAVKAWPLFVLLNAYDPGKKTLLFAASNATKECFFDDPKPHLCHFAELFLHARAFPFLLSAEWIEAILKKDPHKLSKVDFYDETLQWYLRGKEKIDCEAWITAYYPLLNRVYGEMANAWF